MYKCEVREIANILNVPENIIKKPPSAGLWEGQTDEGEIGMTYDIMDEIVYRIDHNLSLNDLNNKKIENIRNRMNLGHHKNNMPPSFQIN